MSQLTYPTSSSSSQALPRGRAIVLSRPAPDRVMGYKVGLHFASFGHVAVLADPRHLDRALRQAADGLAHLAHLDS
jgi:hypothetical protein